MHDFQHDVSHLERLAELWLQATRRRDSAWEWISHRRGISQDPFQEIIFEKCCYAPPGNARNVVTTGTGHDRYDLLYRTDNCRNTRRKYWRQVSKCINSQDNLFFKRQRKLVVNYDAIKLRPKCICTVLIFFNSDFS